jgi:hypothetical protein
MPSTIVEHSLHIVGSVGFDGGMREAIKILIRCAE